MNDKKISNILKNKIDINKLRNMNVSAHVDAGKTTLNECMLLNTGMIHKRGNIDDGDTQLDWRKEERERGITIMSDAASCMWKGYFLNIIDTPGHRDFSAEVIRCLYSIEFTLAIICAVGSIEPQTKFVWSKVAEHKLPSITFINKLDRIGANFENVISDINNQFLIKSIPIVLPIGLGHDFIGIIDLINDRVRFLDKNNNNSTIVSFEEFKKNFNVYSKKYPLLENMQDKIMFDYLMYKSIISNEAQSENREDIIKNLKKKLLTREITLICCGSAKLNIGVIELLDFIIDFAPSPLDRNEGNFQLIHKDYKNNQIVKKNQELVPYKILNIKDTKTIIYIFKIVFEDRSLLKITYVKILSGILSKGDKLYNVKTGKREDIDRIVKIQANKKIDLKSANAGDIVGLINLKHSATNDTLCNLKDFDYELPRVVFPEVIIHKAIKPADKGSIDKILGALDKITLSDPTIKYHFDKETKEMILSGLGELHLNVKISMLYTKYGVRIIAGKPRISYKETITKSIKDIKGTYIKQSGGRGHFAIINIDLEPSDKPFEFIDKLRGQSLDNKYIPAIIRGCQEYMLAGGRARTPITNIKVTLNYGEHHEVDSSDLAFEKAGYDALQRAYLQCEPRMLEPVMIVTIMVPKEYLGSILSDIYSKRGKILTNEEKKYEIFGKIIIQYIVEAIIPLENLSNYSDKLLALSKGQAVQKDITLYKYDFMPYDIEQKKAKNLFATYYKKK